MSLHHEKRLLHSVAGGDQRAFELLIDTYGASVFAHVLMYLKDEGRAEEVTQDIFLSVWNHRAELRGIQNFRGYLFILTRNKTISAFRKKIIPHREVEDEEMKSEDSPAGLLEYQELKDILQVGISHLPPKCQQVFTMSRFENKTYDEIARELNISKSAVNKHVIRALEFLRTYLVDKKIFIFFCFMIPGFMLPSA